MILALDIGATNIRIALVEKTAIKQKIRTPTPKFKKEILEKILYLIHQYKNYQSICVSIAGFEHKGNIQGALNMDFNNASLKKVLKNKFKVPIYIQNDTRSAALAELSYGAGKNIKNFIMLTLGTGIGGAIVINKKIYLGNGTAGEVGSIFIEKNKIFENLASGSSSLDFAQQHSLNVSVYELEKLARMGSKKALDVYNLIGHNLGVGLANLSYILAPEAFIIGGGFSRVKFIYPEAIKTFHKLYNIEPKPGIINAKFGDDAGLIGAAILPKYKL